MEMTGMRLSVQQSEIHISKSSKWSLTQILITTVTKCDTAFHLDESKVHLRTR